MTTRPESGPAEPCDPAALEKRISELEAFVAALRSGVVDALVVDTADGPSVRMVDGSGIHYQGLIDRLPEGVVALSLDGTILFASNRFQDLVGLTGEQLIGRPFLDLVAHADRPTIAAALDDRCPEDAHQLTELQAGDKRGATVSLSIERIDRPGQTTRWVTASDVEHQAHLRYLVDHDHLTGLLNRRAFDATLKEHRALGTVSGAVILVDIDHFKPVNDLLGDGAGDRLLIQVAHGLSASLRGDDLIARLGGDEFAILMPSGGYDAASALASRLISGIRNLELGDTLKVGGRVTVSAGAALFTHGQDTMHIADNALYQAKRAGRDTAVVIGHPDTEECIR